MSGDRCEKKDFVDEESLFGAGDDLARTPLAVFADQLSNSLLMILAIVFSWMFDVPS